MAVFAFALALKPGRPLDLHGARALRPGLGAPSVSHEQHGDGWHAAWRNAGTGPQTDFAIGEDGTVAIVTARWVWCVALRAALGLDRYPGDAALLLQAHARWGETLLDHLRGTFAFVLWDARRHRLIAARDQIGNAPLFYRERDGVLLVGTAFDAIRDHDRADLTLSDVFVGDLLMRGTPNRHDTSIYDQIHRVPAAHALHVAGGHSEVRRYWSFPRYGDPLILRSRDDYADMFYATLREAVAEQLPATGPVVLQLSGGLDSTAVAATAADLLGPEAARARIKAYTTVFLQDPEQEGDFAALVAARLGVEHHLIAADDYLGAPFERPAWIPPEPGPVAALIPEACASAAAEAGGGVLFTGLGPYVYLRPPGTGFRHIAARGLGARPAVARHAGAFGRLPDFGVRTALGTMRRRLARNPASDRPRLPAWIDAGFAARSDLVERGAARWAIDSGLRAAMLTSPYWQTIASSGHPAMAGRAMLPAHPFLSLAMIELAVRLPRAAVTDKAILRWAMRGRLPDAVVDRPKTVLGPAVTNLAAHDPRILARRRALIEAQSSALSAYIDPALAIASLESGDPADRFALATLEMLVCWLEARAA